MRGAPLHAWDLSPREAAALQRELAAGVRIERPPWGERPRTLAVAGADVACPNPRFARSTRGGRSPLTAAVVVITVPDLELVAVERIRTETSFPYVPGLLSFREAPAVLEAVGCLKGRGVAFDAMILDGQGRAHPRGLGLATHVGLWLGLPTVGCAKSRLCGEHGEVGPSRGDSVSLVFKGRRVGSVLRSREGVKPLYVSPGHMIDFAGAERLVVRSLSRYRLPEPTRLAHHAAGFKGETGELPGELERMLERARIGKRIARQR